MDSGVVCHGEEEPLVDSLGWLCLLDNAEHAVVQVLVEVLRVGEDDAAGGAHAGDIADVAVGRSLAARRALSACVGWRLLHSVH